MNGQAQRRSQAKQAGQSKQMSEQCERANRQASGPVLTSRFLVDLAHGGEEEQAYFGFLPLVSPCQQSKSVLPGLSSWKYIKKGFPYLSVHLSVCHEKTERVYFAAVWRHSASQLGATIYSNPRKWKKVESGVSGYNNDLCFHINHQGTDKKDFL